MPLQNLPPVVVETILPIFVIVVLALLALRGVRLFVRGIVKTLFDRETAEGTAQELSALEIQKRTDTIETLGSRVLQAFVVMIATLMVLGKLDFEIGPAVAGLGVVHRGRVRRAEPGPRLLQRSADPDGEPVLDR